MTCACWRSRKCVRSAARMQGAVVLGGRLGSPLLTSWPGHYMLGHLSPSPADQGTSVASSHPRACSRCPLPLSYSPPFSARPRARRRLRGSAGGRPRCPPPPATVIVPTWAPGQCVFRLHACEVMGAGATSLPSRCPAARPALSPFLLPTASVLFPLKASQRSRLWDLPEFLAALQNCWYWAGGRSP